MSPHRRLPIVPRFGVLGAIALLAGCASAPAPEPQPAPGADATPARAIASATAHGEILRTTERIFEGMRSRDTALLRTLLDPGLEMVSLRDSASHVFVRRQPVEAFLRSIASAREELVERFWSPEVRVDGAIATLWAQYDFHIGGRFSHCGRDAFHYLRRDGRWIVTGLLYTVRTTGCEPAPPGAFTPGGASAAPAMRPGAAAVVPGAEEAPAEAVSLLGEPLRRPALPPATRERLERDLDEARAAFERAPDDPDSLIWLGRRTAYLGRYREAIVIFSEGIRRHPRDARMYRHRGHRYITVRELDRAVADLERAAALAGGRPDEVEPDGMPNRFGIPTSTLQSNIWYHLGLAHYLRGAFERALPAWEAAMRVSTNDDMHVATADWLYMTLRRLGRDAEAARVLAPIHRDMRILENDAYHRRLLMYRGELPPDSLLVGGSEPDALRMATQGYGVGNWYLYNGDPRRAREIFERVLSYGNWPAFGHIAAEADLRRMSGVP